MSADKDNLGFLRNSIVYQMSLGSHELFHSNLWAWLMEQEEYGKDIIRIFFPDFAADKPRITREEGNRDITIWDGNKAYVIENKLKSIPTIAQLEKYQSDLEKDDSFAGGVLTGIPKKQPFASPTKWGYISYTDIIGKLRGISFPSNVSEIMTEYCNMVEALIAIVKKEVPFLNEEVPFQDNQQSILRLERASFTDEKKDGEKDKKKGKKKDKEESIYRYLRIDDLLIKLSADAFCRYIKKELPDLSQSIPEGYELVVEPDFTNGSGIVNVLYRKVITEESQKKSTEYVVGIQIQGSQYRYCAKLPQDEADVFAELCTQYGQDKQAWFCNYDGEKPGEIHGYSSKMAPKQKNRKYNKYDGNPPFLYQYFNLDSDNPNDKPDAKPNRTYEWLTDRISKDMKTAEKIVKYWEETHPTK